MVRGYGKRRPKRGVERRGVRAAVSSGIREAQTEAGGGETRGASRSRFGDTGGADRSGRGDTGGAGRSGAEMCEALTTAWRWFQEARNAAGAEMREARAAEILEDRRAKGAGDAKDNLRKGMDSRERRRSSFTHAHRSRAGFCDHHRRRDAKSRLLRTPLCEALREAFPRKGKSRLPARTPTTVKETTLRMPEGSKGRPPSSNPTESRRITSPRARARLGSALLPCPWRRKEHPAENAALKLTKELR